MGKIKKITENELVGGTQNTDVYPVTSVKAVYDESNERLDNILNRRGVVNISTDYNADHIAEVLTLEQAIAKVPSKDRVLGFQGKFLSKDGWKSYVFIGDSIADWTNKTKWNNYLTGTDVVQEAGKAEDKVMSQKTVSDKFTNLFSSNNDLALTISGLCNIKDTISRDTKYNIPLKRGNYSFERKNNEENRRCWIQFVDSSNNVFDYVELYGDIIIDKTLEKDAEYINVTIATIGQSIDIDIVNKFENTLDSINTSVGNIFMFNKEVNYTSDVTNLFAIQATKGFITIIS